MFHCYLFIKSRKCAFCAVGLKHWLELQVSGLYLLFLLNVIEYVIVVYSKGKKKKKQVTLATCAFI